MAAQRDWVETVSTAARIAVEEGHFRADLDQTQFAFELYGIFLAFHLYQRLLREPAARDRARRAFEGLIEASRERPTGHERLLPIDQPPPRS